jgi:hypothetical protein
MNRTTFPEPCETCPELKAEKCTREGGHCHEATTSMFEKGGMLPPLPEFTEEPVEEKVDEETNRSACSLEERIEKIEDRLDKAGIK